MKNWILHGTIVMSLATVLGACDGGGGGSDSATMDWYDASGYACGYSPSPGCDFYYDANNNFWLIDVYNDPYYIAGTNEEYGYWTSPDGVVYYYGNATNSANVEHGRDSISNGAAVKQAALSDSARRLSAKYQLDAATSTRVVSAMNDWTELGQSRKRTAADVAAVTQRITGLSGAEVTKAINAVKTGDTAAYDSAVAKAAQNWSTSPDTMKRIMGDWLSQQGSRKPHQQ